MHKINHPKQAVSLHHPADWSQAWAILDAIPTPTAITDKHGIIQLVNRSWKDFSGSDFGTGKNVGEGDNYFDVCQNSPSGAAFLAGLLAVLRGEIGQFVHEYTFQVQTGSIWCTGRATHITQDGQDYLVIAFEETTRLKKAEEKFQESEENFKYIFNRSPVGKSMTLPGGAIQVNQAFCNILGYEPGELQNRSWQEITHPDDINLTQDLVDALISGVKDSGAIEKRYIRKDGSVIWANVITTLRRDEKGTPLHFITSMIDITAQKTAAICLKNQYAMLNSILESANTPIFSLDRDYQYTCFNQAHASVMKTIYGKEIQIGHSLAEYQTVPEDWQTARLNLDRALGGETVLESSTSGDEFHERRHYEVTHNPILDDTGAVIGVSVFARDVTERKLAQETLHLQSAALESAANAIVITDQNGNIQWANPAFEKLTGFTMADTLGRNHSDLVRSGLHSETFYKEMWDTITAGHVWHNQVTNRRKDGNLYIDNMTITPVRADGRGITHFIAVEQDVTAQIEHEQELEAIAVMTADLREHTPDVQIFPVIIQELNKFVPVNASAISLIDNETGVSTIQTAMGEWSSWIGRQVPHNQGIFATVYDTNHPFVVTNANYQDDFALPGPGGNIRSVICLPLVVNGNLIGGLWLGHASGFNQDKVKILTHLSDIAASAIMNAMLYKEVEDRANTLASLYDAGLAINSVLDHHVQLEFLAEITMHELHAERIIFLRYDQHNACYRIAVSIGFPKNVQSSAQKLVWKANDMGTPVAWVHLHQTTLGNAWDDGDPMMTLGDPEIKTTLLAPVKHGSNILGILGVLSIRPNAFHPSHERLLVQFANQAAVALENANLLTESQLQVNRLKSLRRIDETINASLDLRLTTSVILEQTTSLLHIDAADFLIFDPFTKSLKYANGRGFKTLALQHTDLSLGDGLAGRAAVQREIIHIPEFNLKSGLFDRSPLIKEERFVEYFAVPLISKGVVKGMLELFHRSPLMISSGWMEFLQMLAGQAAIAIDNIEMFDNLQRTNYQLTLAYDATIEGWSRALDLRDNGTEGHSKRVTDVTLRLATTMGMEGDELVHMRRGALLHDIGKMGIPDNILLKTSELSGSDWEVMRRHPEYAYGMLNTIDFLQPALDIPYAHHERWDGTGYPRGLKGEQIPLAARIFAIADVWDALTSNRPYRRAWPVEKAIEYIREQAGKHFDPQVVEIFFKTYVDEEFPSERPGILVVARDHPATQALLAQLKEHFTVYSARSGQAATYLFQQLRTEFVLVETRVAASDDNGRQGLAGAELIENLRALKPNTIGVIISSITNIITITSPLNSTDDGALAPRPWQQNYLMTALKDAINRYHQVQHDIHGADPGSPLIELQ